MKRILALCMAPLALGCSNDDSCVIPDGVEVRAVRRIGCPSDYEKVQTAREDSVFSSTRTTNWLVDREDNDRVYFINSELYRLHYEFASQNLDHPDRTPVGDLQEFQVNYQLDSRRFLLGKLIEYRDQNRFTLEFSAGDFAGPELIEEAFRLVRDELYNGDALLYRPVSARQGGYVSELETRGIPTISSEEVFRGQTYQALNAGTAYGTLRFIRLAELASQAPAPTDIVVLDRVPNDISLVSALITGEFQTPLAHVNILSQNRGTPNMAMRNAWEDPELREAEGTLIRLDVGPQDFQIGPATQSEAETYWNSLRPTQSYVPQSDLDATVVVNLQEARASDSIRVGAKAANLGEMHHITPAPRLPQTPLAIPFAHYRQHLQDSGAEVLVESLLADYPTLSASELRARLFEIRWTLFRAPLSPAVTQDVLEALSSRFAPQLRLRFRSSTNAEDLPGFSGAGLYTSAAASQEEGAEAIANAIKVVWASTFNNQAFVEREFYRIDHRATNMAVLIHPAFVDEEANGVAVTRNGFNQTRRAYYINSQLGEVSVTNPSGLATPEQLLYYTFFDQPEYEIITRSSLVEDRTVLSEESLGELAETLGAIHSHFSGIYPSQAGFAMDVEFKIAADGLLYIKQARPF